MSHELLSTIEKMIQPGKGLLAADESEKTIAKRLAAIRVESTEETRAAYRELLFSTPDLEKYISGVILYEETLYQKSSRGMAFPAMLTQKGILPGIKVDKGLIPFESSAEEQITQGLDGLPDRLKEYKKAGACFAKWRAVYQIAEHYPSRSLMRTHAELLARYAKICQVAGIVPIVEPEVLIDGDHSLAQCAEVTEKAHHALFRSLYKHGVVLELMILKPSMVIAGKGHSKPSSVEEVAEATLKIFRRTVPAAVKSINFLSGGQTEQQATAHLNAMNQMGTQPWKLSFSYARALQDSCMKTWQGKVENITAAQQVLLKRAKLNSAAALGRYSIEME